VGKTSSCLVSCLSRVPTCAVYTAFVVRCTERHPIYPHGSSHLNSGLWVYVQITKLLITSFSFKPFMILLTLQISPHTLACPPSTANASPRYGDQDVCGVLQVASRLVAACIRFTLATRKWQPFDMGMLAAINSLGEVGRGYLAINSSKFERTTVRY
jgi:hypothetical protein